MTVETAKAEAIAFAEYWATECWAKRSLWEGFPSAHDVESIDMVWIEEDRRMEDFIEEQLEAAGVDEVEEIPNWEVFRQTLYAHGILRARQIEDAEKER